MNDSKLKRKNSKTNNKILNIIKKSKTLFIKDSNNEIMEKKTPEKERKRKLDNICPYCHKSLYSKFNKDRHVDKTHLKKDMGQCPICNGKFHNIESHVKKCKKIFENKDLLNKKSLSIKWKDLNKENNDESLKNDMQLQEEVENISFNSQISLNEDKDKKNINEIYPKKNFNILKVNQLYFNIKIDIKDINNKSELIEDKIIDFSIKSKKEKKNVDINEIIKRNMYNILKQYSYISLNENYFLFKNLILGHGKNGLVLFGIDVKGANPVAIKTQKNLNSKNSFNTEILVMNKLKKYKVFPKLYEKINLNEKIFLIETLLLPNIEKFHEFCGGRFSIITIYKIGIEILNLFKLFHSTGYLYLDLKCDNLVLLDNPIKYDNFKSNITFIDFGHCVKYINDNGLHLYPKYAPRGHGNLYYSSINSLSDKPISRKDDIISLCYLLIDLFNGPFPWINLAITKKEIIELKKKYKPNSLCKKELNEVLLIFDNVNNLNFCEEPNYNEYIKILDQYIVKKTKKHFYEIPFDWDGKISEIKKNVYNNLNIEKNNKEINGLFEGYPLFFMNYYLNK